ncbi:MAG: PAS domain S-box protein [Isosphaeraceae bacterium]
MDNGMVRVLLIEDDPDDYVLTRDLFSDIPGGTFDLEWARDFDAGLNAFTRCEHDVCLLDYRLGKRDGLKLLREGLRQGCRAPVILLTGLGDRDLALQALEAGAADYLVKDKIDAVALERSIRYALQQKRHADELEQKVEGRTAELQRVNAALRAGEERYRLVVEGATGFAIMMLDLEGRVATWNIGAQRLFGYDEPEVLHTHFKRFFTPEDQAIGRPEHELRAAHDKGRGDDDNWLMRKDGTRFWASGATTALLDEAGALRGYAKIIRDLTERQRAEADRVRLAAIVESSEDAIVSKDLNGIITSWNMSAERLFGYTSPEAVGQSVTILIPPDRLSEETVVLEHIRRGERLDHFETVRRCKDGTLLDVSLTVSPLADSKGRIIGASKIARDVTNRKRTEAALKDADRRKDEFLATLAHELRNPLAPLRNGLQILRLTGTNDPATEQVQEMLERQVQHMVRLVDDLLELSRITGGKIELRKERVDLATVVRNALDTSRPLIESSRHELTVSLPKEPMFLDADPIRLAQIISNLLNNAAKYTPEGGRIWLSAESEGDCQPPESVVLRVRDNGIGIPPAMLPRVFEMFTQVDHLSDRGQGGLGIGLALVKSLVEMHGGRVQAQSPALDGPGTEFTVHLPLVAATRSQAAIPQKHRSNHDGLPRRRILIVDDHPDAAKSLATLLTILGNDVQVAHDGPAALDAAHAHHPAIMLMDIGLPGMDGYEVARRLRQEPEFQEMSLIALTGWGQEEDRRRSLEAGFDAHLVKPVDFDALQALLARGKPTASA